MQANLKILVEVVYATDSKQVIKSLLLASQSTVLEAIEQSGLLQTFPEIDLSKVKIGIFSKAVTLQTLLSEGDRVEIYRPLKIDPKQARRARI
ncbi:MAG: RnfH family protein [Gammaproteobacteria bacterium]